MVLFGLLLVGLVASKEIIFDIDKEDDVFIGTSGVVSMKITSNPTSGYVWNLIPSGSGVFELTKPGVFVPPSGKIVGESGYQKFEIKCTEKCSEGYEEEFVFVYSRPWDEEPAKTREVTVHVVTDHRVYN